MYWIFLCFISFLHAEDVLTIARDMVGSDLSENTEFTFLAGLTNKSYLFDVEGKKYVIRIPGQGTEKFIDREAEQINSKQAYFYGFSPINFISFDPLTGRQLTPFVEQIKEYAFEEFYRDDLVEEIAHLLHQVHNSSLPFKNRIDFFQRMERLGLYLQEQGIILPTQYLLLKATLQEKAHLDCFEAVPSHGDPVPSNFVLVKGKLLLFDWEYSGLADPASDLAFLSTVMNYSKEQEENLLCSYGATPILKEKIIYFKPIVEVWLGLWGILQTGFCNESQKEFFKTFSVVRFKRAEGILHSEEYTKAIELLSSFHQKDGRLFRIFRIDPNIPLLAHFPKLSDQLGLSQIEFGLWICPYCGILNPIEKRGCVCPNCPLK